MADEHFEVEWSYLREDWNPVIDYHSDVALQFYSHSEAQAFINMRSRTSPPCYYRVVKVVSTREVM